MVYSLPEVLLYDLTIPQKTHHTRLRVGVYGGQGGRGHDIGIRKGEGGEHPEAGIESNCSSSRSGAFCGLFEEWPGALDELIKAEAISHIDS